MITDPLCDAPCCICMLFTLCCMLRSKVRDVLAAAIPGYTVDVNSSGRDYKVYLNVKGDIEVCAAQLAKYTGIHTYDVAEHVAEHARL